MATDTQLTTFVDLYTDLQNRVRIGTGVTATENQAKRYINIALHDMHIGFGEKFPWAERTAVLRTQDDYTTGTVTVTKGSTSVTGASTAWNTNNAFSVANVRDTGKITVNGAVDVYEISSVTNDTALVLSTAYISDDTDGASYTYFEDEYTLASDFLRPIDLQFFDQNRDIPLISRTEFRRWYPRNKTPGKPKAAAILDKGFSGSTTPVKHVRFTPPPDDFLLIPYSYVTSNLAVSSAGAEQTQLSADADEPIVPLQYRHALVFHGLYHWYRDKKNDTRSQEARGEYVDLMVRITGDQEIGAPRPKIEPRLGSYAEGAQRPYSRRSSRHTLGSRFDERR